MTFPQSKFETDRKFNRRSMPPVTAAIIASHVAKQAYVAKRLSIEAMQSHKHNMCVRAAQNRLGASGLAGAAQSAQQAICFTGI